jgi:hypothetical protein
MGHQNLSLHIWVWLSFMDLDQVVALHHIDHHLENFIKYKNYWLRNISCLKFSGYVSTY